MDPFQRDPAEHGLEPALELRSYVAEVKRARAGRERGLRAARSSPSATPGSATIPIGYGDGVPARADATASTCSSAAAACRWSGTVSMDNVTVDLGADAGRRARRRRWS